MNPPPTDPERALLERAAAWPSYPSWRELDADVLRHVAAREGIDFATALLYDRIVRSPEHGPFIRSVWSGRGAGAHAPDGATLAVVPGACYVEYPETGADGRRLREVARERGWRVEVIPVASFGSLADNARTVCDWLRDRPEGPVVLASLSKGGADVKEALARPDAAAAFRNVTAWVSVSGIVFGTALAGWFLGRPLWRLAIRLLCRYRRYEFAVFRQLDRREDGPLAGELELPPGLRTVHVVGFPLTCHLRGRRARRAHRRLAPLGPTDGGGILLGDLARLPGLIFPVWGADHYLEPAWDVRPLIACVLQRAGKPRSPQARSETATPLVGGEARSVP
jgi:hypothetical protein